MKKLDINMPEYDLLYSIYALPNVIMPIAAGYLTKKWGY